MLWIVSAVLFVISLLWLYAMLRAGAKADRAEQDYWKHMK